MKFEYGKKYRLKTRSQIEKEWGSLSRVPYGFARSMEPFLGELVTVAYRSIDYVNIEEDDKEWTWSMRLFEDDDCTEEVHDIFRKLLT